MLQTNLIRYRTLIISAAITALVWPIAGNLAWLQSATWVFIFIAAIAAFFACVAVQTFSRNRRKKSTEINSKKFIIGLGLLALASIVLFFLFYTKWVFTFNEISRRIEDGEIKMQVTKLKVISGFNYSDTAKNIIRINSLSPDQPAEVIKEMGGSKTIEKVWTPLTVFFTSFIILFCFALAIFSITGVIEFYIEDFLSYNIISFMEAENTEAGGPAKSTFISYSRNDKSFVLQLAKDMTQRGVSVWIDLWDIRAGMGWTSAIEMAIDKSDVFLLIVSPDSVKSTVVGKEITRAFGQKKRSIPVIYKPAGLPLLINNNNAIYYREPYEDFLAHLVKEVKS